MGSGPQSDGDILAAIASARLFHDPMKWRREAFLNEATKAGSAYDARTVDLRPRPVVVIVVVVVAVVVVL